MSKLLFLALVFAFFALAGCLQEKQLEQAKFTGLQTTPTAGIPTTPVYTASASPTARPTGAATSRATTTPTPTPTPSATVTCEIRTPGNIDSFSSPATVQLFILFSALPAVNTALVKCEDADAGISLDIISSGTAGRVSRTCTYSPGSSRAYHITVSAGGATCARIISVTVIG